MEKNYWLALGLSMLVLLCYPFLFKKNNQPQPQQIESVKEAGTNLSIKESPSVEPALKAEEIAFSNDLYDIRFSTLGASITEMIYKGEGKVHSQTPLFLPKETEINFGTRITNLDIDLSRVIYQSERKSPREISFVYEKPGFFRLKKTYSIDNQLPVIKLNLLFENLSATEKHVPIEQIYGIHKIPSSDAHHPGIEAVAYQEKIKSEKLPKVQKKGFLLSGNIEWTGMLTKYFAVLLKPDWKILSQENRADDNTMWCSMKMEPFTVGPGSASEKSFFVFAGPQRYELLKNLHMDFELVLSRGFFGVFKIWLLISLKFLNQFAHNFGWAIILLTIGLKILFTPLTHMSYESMRKMQAVQPKMKSIQERYKNDPAKMNREVMELYRRNKVNPMGGCLPMLAQIPIFIAFYQVLNEAIELKGAPFVFWIHDLAEPDKLFMLPFSLPFFGNAFNLLPFFMAGSMYWQQVVTPQASASKEQAQVMKFMPLMMGVILYSMPSGLALYWFVNNMLTVAHQLIIKRMGDVILHHEDRD